MRYAFEREATCVDGDALYFKVWDSAGAIIYKQEINEGETNSPWSAIVHWISYCIQQGEEQHVNNTKTEPARSEAQD